MAERLHVRCGACGSLRGPDAFGIDPDDADRDLGGQHETALLVQTLAGRGRISWREEPLPLPWARVLRARLAAALERLDFEIAEATGLDEDGPRGTEAG